MDDVSQLAELQDAIRDFADRRDWHQFHTPKNLAMAVCGEAGELAAELQWLTPEESQALDAAAVDRVRLEVADVMIYLLRLADVVGIDVEDAVRTKLVINESRFPVKPTS